MKNIVILIFLYAACSSGLNAQNTITVKEFKSAIEYNNYIISEQEKVVSSMGLLTKAIDNGTYTDMDKALDTVKAQTQRSLKCIKSIGAYNKNESFKDAAVTLFSFYCKISKKEFKKMINILKKGDKLTEKDVDKMDKLSKSITAKEIPLDDAFIKAQEDFAKENNFVIGG